MSHELQYPELIIEPEYDWGDSITSTSYNYFYVPSIPEWAYSEFDGLLYEGKEYNWNEVDYRLSCTGCVSLPTPSRFTVNRSLAAMLTKAAKKCCSRAKRLSKANVGYSFAGSGSPTEALCA